MRQVKTPDLEMNTLVRNILKSSKKALNEEAYKELKSLLDGCDLLEGGLHGPFEKEKER